MRLAHESGDEERSSSAPERMAELASRFPGASREIDDLELDAIRDRIRQLDAALRGDERGRAWMEAVGLFHALARGALWAKRWLAGRKTIDSPRPRIRERVDERRRRRARSSTPCVAAPTRSPGRASSRASPRPRAGRIMDLVFARVARTLGTTERRGASPGLRTRPSGRRVALSVARG